MHSFKSVLKHIVWLVVLFCTFPHLQAQQSQAQQSQAQQSQAQQSQAQQSQAPHLQAQQSQTQQPRAQQSQAQQPAGAAQNPVPPVVRDAESAIERQFKRFGAGVRAGVAMDPELLNVGVHATLGPFFRRGVAFRPNVEYAFGELTKMFAINFEAVYFLPFDGDERRFYFGAGPGLNFIDRGLEIEEQGVDFDDFDFDAGLNLIGGVEWRSGAFAELKASAYGGPAIRVLIGYTF